MADPLVSIICFCKDRASTIAGCVESVLGQSYKNIEFVVQDGASTDGTLEILRSYQDDRIKIVSAPDSGHSEAFWKVLNRCQGEIIGTCLSDEELLPQAVEQAVDYLKKNPGAGALTCDGYVTDENGRITSEFNAGEFNLVDYIFGWYSPFWPGSFIRRQALVDVGLNDGGWTIGCLEFEVWLRLGTQHVVKYLPIRTSKYSVHATQLSNARHRILDNFDHRAIVLKKFFSADAFFGEDPIKLNGALYNQLYLIYNHVKAYRLADQVALLLARLNELVADIPWVHKVQYAKYFNFVDNFLKSKSSNASDHMIFSRAAGIWFAIGTKLPPAFRAALPPGLKRVLRSAMIAGLFGILSGRKRIREYLRAGSAQVEEEKPPYTPEFSPRLYADVAGLFYARGQIDEALDMWRKAEALEDAAIDGVAYQAALMSPSSTYESLALAHKGWAERHAKPIESIGECPVLPYSDDRKIRIGYFCAWFDSDVFRAILQQFIKRSDRKKFVVYGYSTNTVVKNIESTFDEFRVTGPLSDTEFVRLVRRDQIDICVEITGFSPFNRFSAMASRCAPIQVSYVNHTGTSGVQNVDYLLADNLALPAGHDAHFTEKIWRLPGCFLLYNYDWFDAPAITPPPSEKRGHITFGYLGSGARVNLQVIEGWAKLLHAVPGSRMYIRNHQLTPADNREFLKRRFERFGISPDRLTVFGGVDRPTLVKCYEEFDISLDTWPYCGGNTVAESLWQGVPVITLKSGRFSGHYGASLLTAAGCPELVAHSEEEYLEIAKRLAGSPERLRGYRSSLREKMRQSGLCDADAFAKKMDQAYIEMMQRLHKLS
jgi:glycosyltransferase involved in cell wall biosynthesis